MLGSKMATRSAGVYSRTSKSEHHFLGERATCELCLETRRCFERCGLVVCQTCQHDFLPPRRLLALP